MQTFGARLRAMRESKGLTQTALARAANMSSQYISDLELGKRGCPTGQILLRLADALDTSVSALLSTDDLPKTKSVTSDKPLSPDEQLRQLGIYLRGFGATEEDLDVIMGLVRERMKERDKIAEAHRRIADIRKRIGADQDQDLDSNP